MMIAYEAYTNFSDADLLHLVIKDNEKAFEEIYERYWLLLLITANKRLHNKESSKDIVQNVFIDLWTRRKAVKIDHLNAYLQQATRFQVFKYFTKSKVNSNFLELVDNIVTSVLSADSIILDKEMTILVNEWIKSLPTKRKNIFLLYVNNNMSTKHISDFLNISIKTAQNQLCITFKDLEKKVNDR